MLAGPDNQTVNRCPQFDFNGDGDVNNRDYTLIINYCLGGVNFDNLVYYDGAVISNPNPKLVWLFNGNVDV